MKKIENIKYEMSESDIKQAIIQRMYDHQNQVVTENDITLEVGNNGAPFLKAHIEISNQTEV